MEWKDLSILDKSKWILFFVSQGITNKSLMQELYDLGINEDPKITYTSWLGAMHNKYPWLELNSEKAGYDYERYFNENYDDAISRLNELESRHFTDKYKLPNHPTFSEESIYSQGPRYGGHWTSENEFIPSIINQLQYPDIYLEYRPYSEDEIYKNGGSIHIKPENRGKFTALKKRTGHSASWFKEHGTPALKKMATFELNSKHWHKHEYGGYLEGEIYDLSEDEIENLINLGYEIEYI